MAVGFSITAGAAGLQSFVLTICGLVVICIAQFAFIIGRARKAKARERLEVATRLHNLQAANWPLTPAPTSATGQAQVRAQEGGSNKASHHGEA
jgi:hypothetical protein